jgi:hypothetical protein
MNTAIIFMNTNNHECLGSVHLCQDIFYKSPNPDLQCIRYFNMADLKIVVVPKTVAKSIVVA